MWGRQNTKVLVLKLVKKSALAQSTGGWVSLHTPAQAWISWRETHLLCYNKLHTKIKEQWPWPNSSVCLWRCIPYCENTHQGKRWALCLKMKTQLARELSWDLAWWTSLNSVFEEAKWHFLIPHIRHLCSVRLCVTAPLSLDHQRSRAWIWVAGITPPLGHYNIQLWLCT